MRCFLPCLFATTLFAAACGTVAQPEGPDAGPGTPGEGYDAGATPDLDAGPLPGRDANTVPGDTTPPETTIGSAPPALDSNVDVSFELEADEPATFTCALDGGTPQPCSSPHLVQDLGEGEHELSVTAADAAGNVDPTPATHIWTVDTTPPAVAIDSGPPELTSDTTPTFAFSSEPGATLECALDRESFGSCVSPRTTASLSDGAHSFRVRARDAAGNPSDPVARDFVIDTVAPVVRITSGPAEDELYLSERVTFRFTVTEANLAAVECRFYMVGSSVPPFQPCSSPVTYDMGGGSNIVRFSLTIRATDEVGLIRSTYRTFRQAVPAG